MTLIEFLLARITEDERGVAQNGRQFPTWAGRLAAECEAKRRIVESMGDDWVTRVLATVHAGHTDYREEWRP